MGKETGRGRKERRERNVKGKEIVDGDGACLKVMKEGPQRRWEGK